MPDIRSLGGREMSVPRPPAVGVESIADARLVAECLRINDRFTREIVEAFDVCPFARHARVSDTATREVLLQTDRDPSPTLELIERLEAGDDAIEVVQVIYPRLAVTPREFEHFNADVRDAHGARRRDGRAKFVHATFHPNYPCDRRTPDALVAFFRRAPDPTIQLVRFSVISAVRKERSTGTVMYDPEHLDVAQMLATPAPVGVSERITRENHARIERDGPEVIEAIQRDIAADRARAYGPDR